MNTEEEEEQQMITEEEILDCPLTKLQSQVLELQKRVKKLEQDNIFYQTSIKYQKANLVEAHSKILMLISENKKLIEDQSKK